MGYNFSSTAHLYIYTILINYIVLFFCAKGLGFSVLDVVRESIYPIHSIICLH